MALIVLGVTGQNQVVLRRIGIKSCPRLVTLVNASPAQRPCIEIMPGDVMCFHYAYCFGKLLKTLANFPDQLEEKKKNAMERHRGNRKGLSRLQKFILDLAREQGDRVLARDVLMKYYGFVPRRSQIGIRGGCAVFHKSRIPGYNGATVAVCKAFNRLAKRGLVRRIIGGVRL